jgi:uncharacterized RDD family membrane protein YckC
MLAAVNHVYLVVRYAGSLGKLTVGQRIVRTDGSRVSYGNAVVRYLPEAALSTRYWPCSKVPPGRSFAATLYGIV